MAWHGPRCLVVLLMLVWGLAFVACEQEAVPDQVSPIANEPEFNQFASPEEFLAHNARAWEVAVRGVSSELENAGDVRNSLFQSVRQSLLPSQRAHVFENFVIDCSRNMGQGNPIVSVTGRAGPPATDEFAGPVNIDFVDPEGASPPRTPVVLTYQYPNGQTRDFNRHVATVNGIWYWVIAPAGVEDARSGECGQNLTML